MAKKTKKTYKELAIEFKKTRRESVYNELYAKMRPGLWSYTNNIVKGEQECKWVDDLSKYK